MTNGRQTGAHRVFSGATKKIAAVFVPTGLRHAGQPRTPNRGSGVPGNEISSIADRLLGITVRLDQPVQTRSPRKSMQLFWMTTRGTCLHEPSHYSRDGQMRSLTIDFKDSV